MHCSAVKIEINDTVYCPSSIKCDTLHFSADCSRHPRKIKRKKKKKKVIYGQEGILLAIRDQTDFYSVIYSVVVGISFSLGAARALSADITENLCFYSLTAYLFFLSAL